MISFGSLQSTSHLLLIRAMISLTTMRLRKNLAPWKSLMNFLLKSKKRGISIIMDLVINHCSDKHEWFQKGTRRSQTVSMLTISIFREGKNGNPPSNLSLIFWRQLLGTSSEYSNKYYLHMFAKEQPDLKLGKSYALTKTL